MIWSKDDVLRLRTLFKEGKTLIKIAAELNRTPDAVRRKLEREGLLSTGETWGTEDEETLRKNAYSSPNELKDLFPTKSIPAISKMQKDVLERDKTFLPAFLLYLLRGAERPLTQGDLLSQVSYPVGHEEFEGSIFLLQKRGFDVKKLEGIVPKYILVRNGEEEGDYYKPLAELETPILVTGDWHVGSKHFLPGAFEEMVKDIFDYKVKSVLALGDQIQGRGWKGEESELAILRPELMCAEVVRLCRPFVDRGVKLYLFDGTHEATTRAWCGGLDANYLIASLLPNTYYVGQVAKMRLNKDFVLVGMHGDGAQTKFASYKIEETFKTLSKGPEKPDILAMGHFHQMLEVSYPPYTLLVQSGTLQRETSFAIRKGLIAHIGWKIILSYQKGSHLILTCHPRSQ